MKLIVLRLLVLLHCLKECIAGVLQPEVVDSVLPYRNNDAAVGKYIFTFKMSSPVPSSPRITIDFPEIYPKIVENVDKCKGSVEVKLKNEKKLFDCQITGRTVTFDITSQWTELDAGNMVVEIFDVINPTGVGLKTTGYFQIRTWSGIDIVIDSNLAFQSIGFAKPYDLFDNSINVVNDGANIAGYTTNYILTFKIGHSYPKGSWFRMRYPPGFTFSPPLECYITNIDPKIADLPCYNEGSTLVMKGLQKDLIMTGTASDFYKIKMRNVVNPKIATPNTENFLFESLKEGVNTVVEYHETINGVAIMPGTITDVTIIGFPLVQNLFVDYSFKFRPANTVPRGGMINIRFPAANYKDGIDKFCRIAYGLKPADETGIKCVTDGKLDLWISNFQELTPQYIGVKCFATNPRVGGETEQFSVRTYTNTNKDQIIDENNRAGTVVISEIQKPNFFEIDFYKKHVNCTFYYNCPISFRYFPDTARTLPRTNTTPTTSYNSEFSAIDMQMPIWWMPKDYGRNYTVPECLFGKVPTAHCYQNMHVVSMTTPETQDYKECELPVSIDHVRVSPIPGKFPFRIWTFKYGSKYHRAPYKEKYPDPANPTGARVSSWYDTPIEQDTYIMDIPATGIAVLQTWSSGWESNDEDNLLHFRSNVHPFLFAWSGTVSILLTHREESLEDKAAWPQSAGQGLSDNSMKEIPCRLMQSGRPTGYKGSWHDSRDVRCLMKTGVYANNEYTMIQVLGFDSDIDKGNYYEMYIPNVKFCSTVNRQCKVLYTYTMTEDYKFPYRISQREQTIARVLKESVPADVLPAKSDSPKYWGSTTFGDIKRCRTTHFYPRIRQTKPIYKNDYFLMKRNLDYWYYDGPEFIKNTYSFNYYRDGNTNYYRGTFVSVFDFTERKEYLVHRILQDLTVPTSTTYNRGPSSKKVPVTIIRLNNVVNTPYKNQQSITDVVLWSGHKKFLKGRLHDGPMTSPKYGIWGFGRNWVDQFVYYEPIQHYHTAVKAEFWVCMNTPAGGGITMRFYNAWYSHPGTSSLRKPVEYCKTWLPMVNYKANETHTKCVYDLASREMRASEFDPIKIRAKYAFHWYYEFKDQVVYSNYFNVMQKNDSTELTTDNTVSEYYERIYSNTSGKIVFDSPYLEIYSRTPALNAISWEYLKREEYRYELHEGDTGAFVFEIETGDFMEWEPTESTYFHFTMHSEHFHNHHHLECRYAKKNGTFGYFHHYPSVECGYVVNNAGNPNLPSTIRMKLHPNLDIQANERYQIFLDTRANDYARDGLTFNKYGVFSINVESFVGGAAQKKGKQRYEIFGRRISFFKVYYSNKLAGQKAHYTYWADFHNTVTIESSEPVGRYHNIMLYFDTVGIDGVGGFDQDLGMGYPDQSIIPCNLLLGFPLLKDVNTPICTLYYGYSGAPARIKIEGFKRYRTRIFRIDIPMIKNPSDQGVIPRTWLKILESDTTAKTVEVIYEGHYYELNTTWVRNTTWNYIENNQVVTDTISMNTKKLGVQGNLKLPFKTHRTLHDHDFVLIKFPIYWPTPWTMDYRYCRGMTLSRRRCYTIRNDQWDHHYLYFELGNQLTDGRTLTFTLPSSRSIIAPNSTMNFFEMFLYHDTRLIATQKLTGLLPTMFDPDPITAKITCLPTTPLSLRDTEYIVTFKLPHNLLSKAEIRIDYEDYDLTANPNCTSTTNSMLLGPVKCSLLPPADTFASVIDFKDIDSNNKVEIKLSLKNRWANGNNRKWRVRTYYLRGGYHYVNGDTGMFDHINSCEVVNTPAAANVPWPTWFHKENRTRAGETGPIILIYESVVSLFNRLVMTGDYIKVFIPIEFEWTKGEKVISWDNEYPMRWDFQTTATHHEIKMWPLKVINIEANKRYRINITTLNGLRDENGFKYPKEKPEHYLAKIEVFKTGIFRERGEPKIFVFQKDFLKYEPVSYLINSGYKASFKLRIVIPPGTPTANPEFRFKLPTTTYLYAQRVNLFDDDGGSGLFTGDPINCHLIQPPLTALSATCTLTRGAQNLGEPALVVMKVTSPISTNTVYELTFDNFEHPPNGYDDKYVEPVLQFWSNNVHHLTGVEYDYTIVQDDTYTKQLAFSPPPTWDTLVIGATNTAFVLKFKTPVKLRKYQPANGIGWADYLILEFPIGYEINFKTTTKVRIIGGPGASTTKTNVEFSSGNRWIIWRPHTDIPANTLMTLQYTFVDQATAVPPEAVFKLLVVQDRELKTYIEYVPITGLTAPAITSGEITLTADEADANKIPKDKYQRWDLRFTTGFSDIPKNGVIQVILPTAFSDPDNHCYNNVPTSKLVHIPGTPEETVLCRYESSSNSFIITNFDDIAKTALKNIKFYAKNEDASPGTAPQLTIKVYRDADREYQILEGVKPFPTNKNYYGFSQLRHSKAQREVPDVLRTGQSAPFVFTLDHGLFNHNSEVILTLPPEVTVPADSIIECFWDELESRKCWVDNVSPLRIKIRPPHTPLTLPFPLTHVSVTTRCAPTGEVGLIYSTPGKHKAFIEERIGIYTTKYAIPFEIFGDKFDFIQSRVTLSNAGMKFGLAFAIKVTKNIPVGGKIRVRMPKHSRTGKYQIFTEPLMKNSVPVAKKCDHVSPSGLTPTGANIMCAYIDTPTEAIFEILDFNAVSAPSILEFIIYDLVNPDITEDRHELEAILETQDDSGNVLNQGVAFDIAQPIKQAISPVNKPSGFTRTQNDVSTPGAQYTFADLPVSPGINENDQVVFEFPDQYYFSGSPLNCNNAQTPGTYKAYGKFIIFKPSNNINAGNKKFCMGTLTNPAVADTRKVKVNVVYSRYTLKTITYPVPAFTTPDYVPPAPEPDCKVTVDLAPQGRSNGLQVVTYILKFTTTCDFPTGSVIQFTLGEGPTTPILSLFSVINAPTVTGTMKIRGGPGASVEIYDYTTVGAGTVEVKFNAYHSYNAENSLNAYFKVFNGADNIAESSMMVRPGTASTTNLFSYPYRPYMRVDRGITAGEKGYFSIDFKVHSKTTSISSSNYFELFVPAGFSAKDKYHRCKFVNQQEFDEVHWARLCYYDAGTKSLKIWPPKNTNLKVNKLYRLDIIHWNERRHGFTFLASAVEQKLKFALRKSNGAIREMFAFNYEVPRALPRYTCFRNILSFIGLENTFMLAFTPDVSVPAPGFLEFEFATVSIMIGRGLEKGFEREMGIGEGSILDYYNNEPARCKAYTMAGTVRTPWGGMTKCVTDYGGEGQLHRPGRIKIQLSASLDAGTTYRFDVSGIKNPVISDVMTPVRMTSGSYSAGSKNYANVYQDNFQLYTVDRTHPHPIVWDALPILIPNTIQDDVNMDLVLLAVPLDIILEKDVNHIYIKYNPDMYSPNLQADDYDYHDAGPGVAHFYSKTTKGPLTIPFYVKNFKTPFSGKPFISQFRIGLCHEKIVAYWKYFTNTNDIRPVPWTSVTVPAPFNSVRTFEKSSFILNLELSRDLGPGPEAVIEIDAISMDSIDPNCAEESNVIGSTFKCEPVGTTGRKLRISGINKRLKKGQVISVKFRATTNWLVTGRFCAEAFQELTPDLGRVQRSVCATLNYSLTPGIKWIEARTPQHIRRVQAGERGMMTFPFTTTTTIPKLDSKVTLLDIDGKFGNKETKDFECFFSQRFKRFYVAKKCIYYASTKKWEIHTPRSLDLTGDYILTIVPLRQEINFNRNEGIEMPNDPGSYRLEMEIRSSTNALLLKPPELNANIPARYSKIMYFNSYLVAKDTFSTFHLKIQPSIAVQATPNGVIKIDFKIKNRHNRDIFNPDLGTDILNGGDYDCPSQGGVVTKCRLYLGNAATPASILVDPQAAMLPTTVYDIDFPALLNPTLNMSEVLMEVSTQALVSGNWENQNTRHYDVFVAQEIIVTPTILPALDWTPNLTGAPKAGTLDFTFTMDPSYGPVKDKTNSFDRIVIKVDRTELDILNDMAKAGKVLDCGPNYEIKIFDSKRIIELALTNPIPAGSTVTLSCTNFLNQQYVIRGGVKHQIELWIDGTIKEAFQYGVNVVNPHPLQLPKLAEISALTPEISSFDTYTFTIKPFNYMPPGSRFEIYFDETFTDISNCEIVSGLNGGICQIQEDTGGFDHIKISKFLLWNPDDDPEIKITVDMKSPPTAGSYDFRFVSFWEENIADPTLEDKIDEDLIGSITFDPFTPFPYLRLEKMYEWTQWRCPHRDYEGVVTFKVQLRETVEYPNYLHMRNFRWSQYESEEWYNADPWRIQEGICYFNFNHILYRAKSERAYLTYPNVYIMVPEELPLTPTNNYTIQCEMTGQRDRGYGTSIDPDIDYIMYAQGRLNGTNSIPDPAPGYSTAIYKFRERACYFRHRSDVVSTNHHQNRIFSTEAFLGTWIDAAEVEEPKTFRMQVQFTTFNEIKAVGHPHSGFMSLTNENDTAMIPCHYWDNHNTMPNPPRYNQSQRITGEVANVNPTYADYLSKYTHATLDNYTNGGIRDQSFRFGWALQRNYERKPMPTPKYGDHNDIGRNHFVHAIVQSQIQRKDGTWHDTNKVVDWYHKWIRPEWTGTPKPGATFSNHYTGILHVTQQASFTTTVNHPGRTWIYWELTHPWVHLIRNRTHGDRWCGTHQQSKEVPCNFYMDPARWSIWRANAMGPGQSGYVRHFGLIESPSIVVDGSTPFLDKEFTLYFDNGADTNEVQTGPLRSRPRVPYIIYEMDDANNTASADMMYRIGVWSMSAYENYTNMMRLWIPDEFSVIGPDCKVLWGFMKPDMNKLDPADPEFGPQCKIYPNDAMPPYTNKPSTGGYHRVDFFNGKRYSRRHLTQYECWFIFEIKLKNPSTDQWPRPSSLRGYVNDQVYPVVNESRYNYVVRPEHDTGRSWVGNTTTKMAHYFRVVRNRKTYEERRQKAGEWAELHMRLWPKHTYPEDISKVEIQIPQSYDIPNGGKKICEVGHDYHTDLEGQFCEISNERMIQVRTNQKVGLFERCTIIRITTEKSVNHNNGFQAPSETAIEEFATNLYIGSKRIEYSQATGSPEPSQLIESKTLNISANVIEIQKETTLSVSFHSLRTIRAGYDTDTEITDAFKKQPQGRIVIRFNTIDKFTSGYQGFWPYLGYTPAVTTPFTVPCQPFKNLKAKKGENLICTVYPAQTPYAFPNYYQPTEIEITNFELIPENTQNLEVHILGLYWVNDKRNLGWVEFLVKEKYGDGSIEKTYNEVRVELDALDNYPSLLQGTWPLTHPTYKSPEFSPNLVGARVTLDIHFTITNSLIQYDVVEVTFPAIFDLPKVEQISAVFKVTPTQTGSVPYSVLSEVTVYPLLNRVNFMIPRALAIYGCTPAKRCNIIIRTAGFRHVPYELPAPGKLEFFVRIINKKQVIQRMTYDEVPAPPRSKFNSILVTMSSQFSGDIFVTYNYIFSPSYLYPKDSTIQIVMNSILYRQIDKSNPPAYCVTNFPDITASCVISEALITVKLNGTMKEGFSAKITAKGIKNPTFVGSTQPTDIVINALHPTGNFINQDNANVLVYKPKKNIDTIIFNIDLSSHYSDVSSDYRFILQNTNTLPPKGILNIELPKSWSQKLISDLKVVSLIGGFTKNKLIFSQFTIRQPSENILLQIIPEFEWPSKEKLIVVLDTIINPNGITETEPCKIYTQYDSVLIDKSDETDPASIIRLKPYDPKITVWKSQFSPRNEGEIATYELMISSELGIKKGENVQFIFPETYSDILTTFSLSIKCTSPIQIGTCTAKNRILEIPIQEAITPDQQFVFTIEGISNPNAKTVNFVDVAVTDSEGTVDQFINKAFSIESIEGATYTPLAKVATSKKQILIKSDYEECLTIEGDIPKDAAIILDFPKQFDMRKDSYSCTLGTGHDSSVLSYPSTVLDCKTYKHIKRIAIYGHSSAYTHSGGAKKICYKVFNIENSQDTGESFHFNMRVFDIKARKILYKSIGILNYPSTLSYERKGLRIFVDSIPAIPLGTMSNDIKVTLENPVPYDVTLTPSCPGLKFIPEKIVFKFYEGQTQTFRVDPDVTVAKPGTYAISWVKEENSSPTRFSEMVDTFVDVVATPDYRQLKLTISQDVYRASVGAVSMPVYVYLSHPASSDLRLYYKTKKPFQPEFVKFDPQFITIPAGSKEAKFNYKTSNGAVSGLIELQLEPEFRDIYYLPTTEINFEIEDIDNKKPEIEEIKMIELGQKDVKMRVSSDESTKIHYICSIKGTTVPSIEELKDASKRALSKNKPRTPEIQGSSYSEITSQTRSYIYHDTYLNLENLNSNTEYVLYMMPEDLSGNVGEIKEYHFKTAPIPPPMTFKLKSSANIPDNKLLEALSLVSGITTDKFKILFRPSFNNIPTGEQEVKDVLDRENMEYEIMILPDTTLTSSAKSPYDYLKQIEYEKETLFAELPSLDSEQMISETGREITFEIQKFTYEPVLEEVSNFHALFNVSIFYTGTVYGVILPADEDRPSAAQVKDGLTSVNKQVLDKYYGKVDIEVNTDKPYQIYPSANINFTFLYHSSPYVAYFTAERKTFGDPELMADEEVLAVPLKTKREIFRVEDHVIELATGGRILKMLTALLATLFCFLTYGG